MPKDVRAPLKRPVPATPSVVPGVVVPMPTFPDAVAKVAPADAVMKVVEAYVAVKRLPLVKVRSASSVNAPAVVRNGIRVDVREETVRFVDEAVVAEIIVVDAYGNTDAVEVVAVK